MHQLKQIHHSGYADIRALVHPLNGGVFDVVSVKQGEATPSRELSSWTWTLYDRVGRIDITVSMDGVLDEEDLIEYKVMREALTDAMQAQIDEARDVAAALIDAFDQESSPPAVAARKARGWLSERIEAAQ